MSVEGQKNILLHFYKSMCGSILPAVSSSSLTIDAQSSLHSSLTHKPVETYTMHEVHTYYVYICTKCVTVVYMCLCINKHLGALIYFRKLFL